MNIALADRRLPGLTIILLTLLFWPVAAGLRWHYGRKLELEPPEKRLRLAVRLVCILDAVFILGWGMVISMADDPSASSRTLDPILMYGIQTIGVLGAIGTLLVLFHAIQSWCKPGRWVWSKLFDTLLALSSIAFTWFIWHWNLINFNLKYRNRSIPGRNGTYRPDAIAPGSASTPKFTSVPKETY